MLGHGPQSNHVLLLQHSGMVVAALQPLCGRVGPVEDGWPDQVVSLDGPELELAIGANQPAVDLSRRLLRQSDAGVVLALRAAKLHWASSSAAMA